MYKPYKPTAHAEQRRLEMGLGTKPIKRAINDPEVIYPGGWNHEPGRTLYARDNIAVILSDETGEVITILWRGVEFERPEDKTSLAGL